MSSLKLNWADGSPADYTITDRVIYIADGEVGYYADLPAEMDEEAAIDDFVSSYCYREGGTEEQLRADLTVELYEDEAARDLRV